MRACVEASATLLLVRFSAILATTSALALMSVPSEPMMVPHTITAKAAPTECDVFQIDILVASSDG